MSCSIHFYAERLVNGNWEAIADPADKSDYDWLNRWQQYTSFSFLANARNQSGIVPLSLPKGLPSGVSDDVLSFYKVWQDDAWGRSWYSLDELKAVDWGRLVNDTDSHGHKVDKLVPLSDFASSLYEEVEKLIALELPDPVRVVFWFTG